MRVQVEQTVEIVIRVRRRWLDNALRDTIKPIRVDVVNRIAQERGINPRSVRDKPSRKFHPDIRGIDQFDLLLEQNLVSGSQKLRNIPDPNGV